MCDSEEPRVVFISSRESVESLGVQTDRRSFQFLPRFDDLRQLELDRQTAPLAIVFFQKYPNQVRAQAIAELVDRFPLTNIIAVVGSWCEGEAINDHRWAGVQRIYEFQLQQLFERSDDVSGIELFVSRQGCMNWSRSDETLLESALPLAVDKGQVRNVIIRAIDRDGANAQSEACLTLGYQPYWIRALKPETVPVASIACLWNTDLRSKVECQRLKDYCRSQTAQRVIALLHFPRKQDRQLALQLGAQAILALPFRLRELASVLTTERNLEDAFSVLTT